MVVFRHQAVPECVDLQLVHYVLQVGPQELKGTSDLANMPSAQGRYRVDDGEVALPLKAGGGLVLLNSEVDVEGEAAPAVDVEDLGVVLGHKASDGVLVLVAVVVQGGHDLRVK